MKEPKIQLNIPIKKEWKPLLERTARQKSLEENRTISMLNLIRETLQKEFNLP